MSAKRILVLQMKRIGDLILTAQALADLRAAHSRAEIVLVAAESCRDLAECLPGVTQVLPYRPGRVNPHVWAAVSAGEWDACLDFTGSDRSALLSRLSGAAARLGYRKFSGQGLRALAYTGLCPASVRDLHTRDFHRALVVEWTGKTPPVDVNEADSLLHFSPAIRDSVAALVSRTGIRAPFAILHPGTARREKFWPADRWGEVAAALRQMGATVVMTGTGTGLEAEDVAVIRAQAEVVDLTGQLRLSELAALISQARLALGVDSMAMHLAALSRVPQVVLFGPTNPFHWRPLHARAAVLCPGQEEPVTQFDPRRRGGAMEDISARAVIASARRLWAGD